MVTYTVDIGDGMLVPLLMFCPLISWYRLVSVQFLSIFYCRQGAALIAADLLLLEVWFLVMEAASLDFYVYMKPDKLLWFPEQSYQQYSRRFFLFLLNKEMKVGTLGGKHNNFLSYKSVYILFGTFSFCEKKNWNRLFLRQAVGNQCLGAGQEAENCNSCCAIVCLIYT